MYSSTVASVKFVKKKDIKVSNLQIKGQFLQYFETSSFMLFVLGSFSLKLETSLNSLSLMKCLPCEIPFGSVDSGSGG